MYDPARSLLHQLGLTSLHSLTGSGTPLQVRAAVVATHVLHMTGHLSETTVPTAGLKQDDAPTKAQASGSWTPLHAVSAVIVVAVVVVQVPHKTGHVAAMSKRANVSIGNAQNGARLSEQIAGSTAPLQCGGIVVAAVPVVVVVVVVVVVDDGMLVVVVGTNGVLPTQLLQSTGQRLRTVAPNKGSEQVSAFKRRSLQSPESNSPLHLARVTGGGHVCSHVIGHVSCTSMPTIGCVHRAEGMARHCAGSGGESGHGPGSSVVVVAVAVVELAVVVESDVVVVVAVVAVVVVVVAVAVVAVVIVPVVVVLVVVVAVVSVPVVVVAVAVVDVAVLVLVVDVCVSVVDDVVHEPHSDGHMCNRTSLPSCLAVWHSPGE